MGDILNRSFSFPAMYRIFYLFIKGDFQLNLVTSTEKENTRN